MSAYRTRVVIVDDHAIFRAGVRAELAEACEIVGEAGDVAEALAVAQRTEPDVVLLDVHLPGGGAVAVLERLDPRSGGPSVLVLSVSDAAEDVVAVIRAGALGYVTKTIGGPDLVAACRPHCTVPFEAHLMVHEPTWILDAMVEAGCRLLIVHAEACTHLHRTLGIASLGGATLDNEENYLMKKLYTAMGAIQIENQARI